jgi:L,D-peptidoglycan transpeptidase YkuD (ErfK/YbiS/YcfS/YnhG family)
VGVARGFIAGLATAGLLTALPAAPAAARVEALGSSGAPERSAPPTTAVVPQSLPDHLRGVHDARQLVVVTAPDYGTSYATVRVYHRRSDGWHRTMGPWAARIGAAGFAPRGDKREGDDRTPTGSFRLPFMFGVAPDPGVHFRYRRALSTSRWDDDSASSNYNRWVDTRYGYPGRSPEDMQVLPNYRYGAVIGYNLSRTPGKGSAIFFHVTDGKATLGCVSVSRSRVVRLLRYLRPGLHPRFIMGTTAAVTR